MVGYTTLGTNDLERGAAFYDELLGLVGAKRLMDVGRGYLWGIKPMDGGLMLIKPVDEKPATVGNGVMAGLLVDSREKVDAVYKKALELGGTDEGPAGPRGEGFYAGYFRDLDGNKLNVFCMG